MKILVDADACPVKDLVMTLAKKHKTESLFFADTAHARYETTEEYISWITVEKGFNSADFALINKVSQGDIVLTADYGVAAMALSKGAQVMNFSGKLYTDDNMDQLLMQRHIHQSIRKAGGRTPNAKKRLAQQNQRFYEALDALLNSN